MVVCDVRGGGRGVVKNEQEGGLSRATMRLLGIRDVFIILIIRWFQGGTHLLRHIKLYTEHAVYCLSIISQ